MPAHQNYCKGATRSAIHGKGLTDDDVRAIRAAEGRLVDIGKPYGISGVMVHFIKKRKKWAHVRDQVVIGVAA